ncbi:fungal-specific transcription factor domain-containing protein [Pestalotiopsis sp. NC0098]|nr:fungal-specific transcription factor domain-containing protein [Pestalotiopsis sp. NC0098]
MASKPAPDRRGPNAKPRRHTTTACIPCRESKVKCDGSHPVCQACVLRQRDCSYNLAPDRRKIPLRTVVEIFARRTAQLETCLRSCNNPVPDPYVDDVEMLQWLMESYAPESTANRQASGTKVVGEEHYLLRDAVPAFAGAMGQPTGDRISSLQKPDHVPNQTAPDISFGVSPFFPLEFTVDPDLAWSLSMMPGADLGFDNTLPDLATSDWIFETNPLNDSSSTVEKSANAPPPEVESSDEEEEGHSHITKQLSDRLGSLIRCSVDGQWRFYGATSNLHLVHYQHHTHKAPKQHERLNRIETSMEEAGVGHAVDEKLIDHLVSLYFTWQNPSLHVVDQSEFEKARKRASRGEDETGVCSTFLTNAICAIGALFERKPHLNLPTSLSDFFADRAKAILDMELASPRLSTIQALAILSIHEGIAIRDTRAWVYSGMAVRLAYDFGLHTSPKQYVDTGEMTPTEARLRNTTFWGVFVVDRMWAIYLGRPFQSCLEDITVERPLSGGPHSSTATSVWKPYGTA